MSLDSWTCAECGEIIPLPRKPFRSARFPLTDKGVREWYARWWHFTPNETLQKTEPGREAPKI